MKLKIVRDIFTDKSTIGKLTVDSKFFSHTLEDKDRKLEEGGEKVYGQTCIPRGIYQVIIDFSPKYNKEMPHVMNVPGYEGIRFHPLNKPEDSEGCIGVGNYNPSHPDWISNSTATFNKLMDLLETAYSKNEPITLDIS